MSSRTDQLIAIDREIEVNLPWSVGRPVPPTSSRAGRTPTDSRRFPHYRPLPYPYPNPPDPTTIVN